MRIAVKFSRTGGTRFISHLDMQRTMGRALRRSGLRLKMSSGFNPHIVMSFASALGVGMETTGDYLEFSVTEDAESGSVITALNACLPPEIRITDCYIIKEGSAKLMALVNTALIEFVPEKGAEERFLRALTEITDSKEYFAEKKTKSGFKTMDIRPMIKHVSTDGGIFVTLMLCEEATLSPSLLLKEIRRLADADINVRTVRRELYAADGRPLYECI